MFAATQWDSPHNEYAREELKKLFHKSKIPLR
jgi:hypothetical protein